MLAFDPQSPFPLIPAGAYAQTAAKLHAREADRWIGLEADRIEKELSEKRTLAPPPSAERDQMWLGLPVDSLLTPYVEIRELLAELAPPPGSTLVDLGAGYGRIGFVLARHYPDVSFIGYEVVPERVQEGRRCMSRFNSPRAQLIQADLAARDFMPKEADYYFMYDYGTRDAIEKTIQDLRSIAMRRSITVIGRGRASRDAIERQNPWLSQIHAPRHFKNYSIYRSHP